jgi:non-specific protein-tyrosine kinase
VAELVTLKDPRSPAAEAYRVLRTNIQYSAQDKPIHTLVVAAPSPDETKSLTAANLAVAMAQGGLDTLLVDADVRRPVQHTLWGLSNERGLTSLIGSGEAPAQLAAVVQSTGVKRLSVLTSGPLPADPADVLGGAWMGDMVRLLAQQASMVLFDAPPVLSAADAAQLGAHCDGLLLVIRAGATRRELAQRAKESLARVNVRIVGVALTNAPQRAGAKAY